MIQPSHCVSKSYAFNRLTRNLGVVAALGLSWSGLSLPAQAEVLSDSSERQIRAIAAAPASSTTSTASASNTVTYKQLGTQTGTKTPVRTTTSYATPANASATTDLSGKVSSYVFGGQQVSGDSMQGLIQQKQQQYQQVQNSQLTIEERSRIRAPGNTRYDNDEDYSIGIDVSSMDFERWLNAYPYRAQQVADYRRYLSQRVGAANVPPMDQLLTTARSWATCGYEPYQLPPQYLWQNMVPTLKLYATLKQQGLLPASTEIRSVYRSPDLNQCAGGANASKHMSAGAIDIWVPEYENSPWQRSNVQDVLCDFWLYQGVAYDFGLGLYSTGAIHLDTQGYRKWGSNHSSTSSPCRYG
ncbi:D-Ala-D-Ala carboxypeptidase family metallohydrolase [Psychrobacter arenosus]|uniref:D-Ala-D-Ala carboxypeptidase family metallohydrolase n=1 Tax=Psychrobacter arenosus TaxID=256326 RepID=UPI001D11E48C